MCIEARDVTMQCDVFPMVARKAWCLFNIVRFAFYGVYSEYKEDITLHRIGLCEKNNENPHPEIEKWS